MYIQNNGDLERNIIELHVLKSAVSSKTVKPKYRGEDRITIAIDVELPQPS